MCEMSKGVGISTRKPHKADQSFDADRNDVLCRRSFTAKMGKPKGSKNKKPSGNSKMSAPKTTVEDESIHDARSPDDDADTEAAAGDDLLSGLSWCLHHPGTHDPRDAACYSHFTLPSDALQFHNASHMPVMEVGEYLLRYRYAISHWNLSK